MRWVVLTIVLLIPLQALSSPHSQRGADIGTGLKTSLGETGWNSTWYYQPDISFTFDLRFNWFQPASFEGIGFYGGYRIHQFINPKFWGFDIRINGGILLPLQYGGIVLLADPWIQGGYFGERFQAFFSLGIPLEWGLYPFTAFSVAGQLEGGLAIAWGPVWFGVSGGSRLKFVIGDYPAFALTGSGSLSYRFD